MSCAIDPADPPPRRAAIFVSYGWGDAEKIAARIKASLEEAGYDVWIDRENIKQDDEHFWIALEDALNRCELVVALLSPYSVRLQGERATPHGASVCHYELMMAVRKEKAVVPIMVIACDMPLAIIRYEPLVFTEWHRPEAYREGIRQILHAIRDVRGGDRRYVIYVDKLSPYDFFAELKTAAGGFVGRDWLLARLDAWLQTDRRCFLIEAEPGSGKTALVAELVRRNPGGRILAYHFCNALKPDTVNARMFVRYLAAMLCGTVSAYAQRLRHSEELLNALQSNDPTTMLSQGVLAALRHVPMDGAHYLIVDALDEAAAVADGTASEMSIPQLLSQALGDFPLWLKLVVTTRRDDRVVPRFQQAERCFLGESIAAQREDLRQYVEDRVADPLLRAGLGADEAGRRRAVAIIAERSAGNFQYAATVLDELRGGALAVGEIDHLPAELVALYYRSAAKRFPAPRDFAPARTVLSVLHSARQPLTCSQLALVTGLDRDDELLPVLDRLSCFVTWDTGAGNERVYRLAHKSIDDWLVAPPVDADRFKIDPAQGRELILRHCRGWATHREPYALTWLIAHLLEVGLTGDALATIRDGFFVQRRNHIDPRHDLDDTRALILALVRARDEPAILELAKTDNVWQRDGVAAGLQAAQPDADDFVDRVVGALLEARS
jgi:hypothetical protein